MLNGCEAYLTELCGKLGELAASIHKRSSWAKYEDLLYEVERATKNYPDCTVLIDAFNILKKEYEYVKEHGIDKTEDTLLDLSNNIIQTLI